MGLSSRVEVVEEEEQGSGAGVWVAGWSCYVCYVYAGAVSIGQQPSARSVLGRPP